MFMKFHKVFRDFIYWFNSNYSLFIFKKEKIELRIELMIKKEECERYIECGVVSEKYWLRQMVAGDSE